MMDTFKSGAKVSGLIIIFALFSGLFSRRQEYAPSFEPQD